jgi:hypothetical protein
MPICRNMTYHGSRNSVPGAMRAASVRIAGHVIRVQETAKAAGIPNSSPSEVEPTVTMRLLSA